MPPSHYCEVAPSVLAVSGGGAAGGDRLSASHNPSPAGRGVERGGGAWELQLIIVPPPLAGHSNTVMDRSPTMLEPALSYGVLRHDAICASTSHQASSVYKDETTSIKALLPWKWCSQNLSIEARGLPGSEWLSGFTKKRRL